MIKKNSNGRVALQRILGVLITLGIFIFLTVKGQEVPEWVQFMMVLGLGSLIVGVEGITGVLKAMKSIKFTIEDNLPDLSNKDSNDEDKQ